MLDVVVLLTGLTLIVYGLNKWLRLNNDYFKKRGIPYHEPYLFVGNTGGFFLNKYSLYDFILIMYNSFPSEKIFGLFDRRNPFFFIRDPEIIRQFAVKDFDYFQDHKTLFEDNFDRLFSNSLFMLQGDKWRDMRATLSPAFTGSKMRQMFELISECAEEMSKYFIKIQKNRNELNCDIKEIFSKYSNDVIASTAFGIKVNTFENPNNEFFKVGKIFQNVNNTIAMLKILLIRIIPSIMRLFGIEFIDKRIRIFFRTMVLDTIQVRQEKNIFRPDMINLLMQVKMGNKNVHQLNKQETSSDDNTVEGFATVEESSIGKRIVKREWNDDEIVAQCFLFFIAGFDSSATVLSFLTYELALNTDIQQKLYEEVIETDKSLGDKYLNYDSLQKMIYMDMIVSETLRKYPPATATDRACVKEYSYDDGNIKFKVEKGTSFWIPIYGLHHDPKYFPNPNIFDPERFNDENKNSIIPGTYLPFGVGPRNCIGSRFALMEIKVVIYYLIKNFKFLPNKNTQIPLKLAKTPLAVVTEKGIHLDMKPRND